MPEKTYLIAVLIVVTMLVPATVYAGPIAYIGLYNSGTITNPENCFRYSELYEEYDVWVWVLPGDDAMICTQFSIDHHDWVYVIGTTINPEHSVFLGNPIYPNGVSVCFSECQYEWVWLYHLEMLTKELEYGTIEIRERPSAGVYQIADCNDGYPERPLTILNHFGYMYENYIDEQLRITDVTTLDHYTLNVTFGLEWSELHPSVTYKIYNAVDITDTLVIQHREMIDEVTASITLGEPMMEGGRYIVDVDDYCAVFIDLCGPWLGYSCRDLEFEFQVNSPVATESKSWGAIKGLYSK